MAAPMQEKLVRRRLRETDAAGEFTNNHDAKYSDTKEKQNDLPAAYVFGAIFCCYLALFAFVVSRSRSFPDPQSQYPNSPRDAFYETNARIHLKQFSLHGPRVVGSVANEIYAYQYIVQELTRIKQGAIPSKLILIDEQNATGSFDIQFLSDFVSVYRNIKNVAAMLKSETGSEHSLLMSCHFDSSIDSPGAGDNAISCAVMLEVLRVFSQSNTPQHHNIIFLFNGAEENLLQASHGFITKHPWADSIRAFVNIDSAGAGGWEVVFQTGPAHPWLVRAYAESAPYPSGTIFGQDIFQSGVIPSDTDYRIYRDFGEVPGLDIAYITNGYVYHTPNDKNKFIHPGCVQRGGENLLALLGKLSSSPQLADPGQEKHGTMIFFDVVGYFMIYYPQSVALVMNSGLVAAIVFRIIRKTFVVVASDEHDPKYLQNLTSAILCMVLTWILVTLTCVAMGLLVTLLGHNMSWFTHNYNMVPLFLLPPLIVMFTFHDMLKKTIFKNNSIWYNEQIFFEATMTVWGLLLLILTIRGTGSAFLPMLYVLGPLFLRDRTMWIFKQRNWRGHPVSFLCLHMLSLVPPLLMTVYIGYASLILFIPIFGRSGSVVNSDIALGVLCVLALIPLTGYLVSLCYIVRGLRKLSICLGVIVIIWLAAIILTPLGFPYSGSPEQPSPMRLLSVHARRKSHDLQGSVKFQDSGIWLVPFDYNNYKYLVDAVPRFRDAQPIDCGVGPYCGMPFLIPVIDLFHPKSEGSLYLPVKPHERPDIICSLLKKERDKVTGYLKLDFEISGPDHMSVQVRPHRGVSLERWSLSEYVPEPAAMPSDVNETTYFVYYSHGQEPDTPWQISLYLKTSKDHEADKGIVDIGLAGHYLHSEDKHTEAMDAFLDEVPDWATPVTWAATWDGYIF